MANKYRFLGVRVDNVTVRQVIDKVTESIKSKKPCNIITVNPELVMAARKNQEFKSVIDKADIVTPDGVGLLMVGQLTKRHLTERVTGVDLCDHLAKLSADNEWGIYLLGARPGVAAKAALNLQKKYPKLIIAGTSSADPQNNIKNNIISAKPQILLVAYGSPTQELWIKNHQKDLGPIITVGVGGSFDFIAGNTKRAPKFIQKIGLEWLWRFILQPWRWKRMLSLPKFAILALFE